ncbi:ferredoxin, 2Fe-2S [Paraburkholderia tuberum]|uniref:Ferredoxin, 2Fe-2S n=1 Tax=Paraburkholderia tuberum TaxID=157910 RepID=A0A1H1KD52_9BURK|nr:ferredoxin, 2Fe-2S [Paraburkholderia tuberum]
MRRAPVAAAIRFPCEAIRKISLAPPDDEENNQFDNAWGLDLQSRLACCVKLHDADLTIELPPHTRELAREH